MLGKSTNTAPAVSRLDAQPTSDTSPLTVTFSTIVTDFEGDDIFYRWDFGDGQTSTEEDPSHTFPTPGTYTVTLTVTDAQGASTAKTITITVYEEELPPSGCGAGGGTGGGGDNQTNPLTVTISASPTSGHAPLEVLFEAIPSRTYHNMSYTWSFGDGTRGSGRTVSHTYTASGTYYTAKASVRIRVTPAGGGMIGFDCLTTEADTMSCSDDGNTCTMSGNVVILLTILSGWGER